MSQPAAVQATLPTAVSRNYGLDVLRIVSIAGVVAIHIFGLRVGAAPKYGTSWWIATALDIGSIWVVPVFVMISGALLLGSKQVATAPAAFYRKRALRLVPALIVWNLVYLVGVRIWMRHEVLTTSRIIQLLFDESVFTQLYFLWLILGLYAVAPLLASFLREGGPRRALATAGTVLGITVLAYVMPGVLAHFHISRPITLNFLTQWIPFVGYFLAGYALRNVRLKGVALALAALATAALIVFTIWHYGHKGLFPILDSVVSISYLGVGVALIALGVFVVGLSVCDGLTVPARVGRAIVAVSNATFGVFLIHLLIFEVIRLRYFSAGGAQPLTHIAAAYLITLVASFAVSLLAARIPLVRRVF